jgi:hypothetical protein
VAKQIHRTNGFIFIDPGESVWPAEFLKDCNLCPIFSEQIWIVKGMDISITVRYLQKNIKKIFFLSLIFLPKFISEYA